MRKRRPNYRLVKIHRNYTVEEIARLFGAHKNTVRQWIRSGLRTLDRRRPLLVHGSELSAFLRDRKQKNKRPCQPGEIYCVRCRVPRLPAGEMAEYIPITSTIGNLAGICPECDTMIYQRVSLAKLPQVRGKLEVTFLEAQRRVSEPGDATVNSDLSQGEKP
jgi:excisionase family DNA binding protein